ncbi:hypothetical protein MASR2M15_14010 [Anaerolineales bacterium]
MKGFRAKNYDFRFGETDLMEKTVHKQARSYLILLSLFTFLLCAVCSSVLIFPLFSQQQIIGPGQTTALPTDVLPTLDMVTVTVGIPTVTTTGTPTDTLTPTITSTPEPCIQQVIAGDSLIAVIVRCGHQSLDVIPTVLAINGLASESSIIVGQQLVVPWPTATIDPNITPTDIPEVTQEVGEGDDGTGTDVLASFSSADFDPFAPTATATLPAGVMWHQVVSGENIISIVSQHKINVKILSELNPEVDFARCDFGFDYGGPESIFYLSQGQQLRVPAPTPTPTLSPTPNGSETPTPTLTPTFNVPNAVSPSDREFFTPTQLITLRWVPTGSLNKSEVYRVFIHNLTTNESYEYDTRDLYFVVPALIQGKTNTRFEYEWYVAIADTLSNQISSHQTEARRFFWQGFEAESGNS